VKETPTNVFKWGKVVGILDQMASLSHLGVKRKRGTAIVIKWGNVRRNEAQKGKTSFPGLNQKKSANKLHWDKSRKSMRKSSCGDQPDETRTQSPRPEERE